jgi:hypothetical protein
MGIPRQTVEQSNQDLPPFEVWPENWPTVQLFEAMATQWRFDPSGNETGLDYSAIEWPLRILRLRGRQARTAVAGMRVMEAAWLKRVNARRGRAH